uniref:S-methyl-5'-thioadenosine phosphorylase n=1 Tax=Herpetomonas muscarum TaxID=5718 RepID=U5KLM5_HERMU|nr:S-methyl-5-thioadenosine phosphorylase [Herpetomonas muscarum]
MSYASPHPTPVKIGVIGGSGVYKLSCLQDPITYDIDTPFGKPSGPVCVANVRLGGSGSDNGGGHVVCAFLPRHGPHHSHNPSEVNYRANICAMRQLGVEYILAINAVGSLDEKYKPGDLVLVDQFIDRTVRRESSFFAGIGVVAHADFAFPTSRAFSQLAFEALCETFPHSRRSPGGNLTAEQIEPAVVHARARTAGDAAPPHIDGLDHDFAIHASGTLVVMEGPQFSTRAESLSNKHSLKGHMIGMTSCPEAKLAREAEIVYATVAMVTDNDAWQHEVPHVDVQSVMRVVKENGVKAQLYPPAILGKLGAVLGLVVGGTTGSPAVADAGDIVANNSAAGAKGVSSVSRQALEEDPARNAMQFGVMTAPDFISDAAKTKLGAVYGKKYPALCK